MLRRYNKQTTSVRACTPLPLQAVRSCLMETLARMGTGTTFAAKKRTVVACRTARQPLEVCRCCFCFCCSANAADDETICGFLPARGNEAMPSFWRPSAFSHFFFWRMTYFWSTCKRSKNNCVGWYFRMLIRDSMQSSHECSQVYDAKARSSNVDQDPCCLHRCVRDILHALSCRVLETRQLVGGYKRFFLFFPSSANGSSMSCFRFSLVTIVLRLKQHDRS